MVHNLCFYRKLKNRIAAQTARDRKKFRMDELEEAIAQLQTENRLLHQCNDELRSKSSSVAGENDSLRERMEKLEQGNTMPSIAKRGGTPTSECNESAALAGPQQKGHTQILITSLITALMMQIALHLNKYV